MHFVQFMTLKPYCYAERELVEICQFAKRDPDIGQLVGLSLHCDYFIRTRILVYYDTKVDLCAKYCKPQRSLDSQCLLYSFNPQPQATLPYLHRGG